MKNFLLSLILIISSFQVFAQDDLQPTSVFDVVYHDYYSLEYSEDNEQAVWVFYKLTPDLINGSAERKNNFKEDPKVRTGSATLEDYKGSGYDRGHLCPAAAMKINQTAMDETFYMSNMSPQDKGFNRGIWKNLEALVRNFALDEGKIYVVSGPIFEDNIGTIGDGVTVPGYYYKAIYDPIGEQKMIGFILPNEKLTDDLGNYTVTIDEIESRVGRDFFSSLPDSLENFLESEDREYDFTITRSKNMNKASNSSNESNTKTNVSDDKCQAKTSKGTQCKRKAEAGSKYCWQHK